jgi:phosphoglycolate phosphatase-like HAD superfamily hydrolase
VSAQDIRAALGGTLRDTVESVLGEPLTDEDWADVRARLMTAYHHGPLPALVPAARPTLHALAEAGCRQSVVSQWPQHSLDHAIEQTGLRELFRFVDGAASATRLPKTEQLAAVIRRGELAGARATLVGDTLADALAARDHGIDAVICTSYTLVAASHEDLRSAGAAVVDDIAQVLRIVEGSRHDHERTVA